jgi:hypothetical protein
MRKCIKCDRPARFEVVMLDSYGRPVRRADFCERHAPTPKTDPEAFDLGILEVRPIVP